MSEVPLRRFSVYKDRSGYKAHSAHIPVATPIYDSVVGKICQESNEGFVIELLYPKQLNWGFGHMVPTRFYFFGKDGEVGFYVENQEDITLVLQETPRPGFPGCTTKWTDMTDVDPTCPICFDEPSSVVTKCGHLYCGPCFTGTTADRCPVCNVEGIKRSSKPIITSP